MKITKKVVEVFVDDGGGEHATMEAAIKACYRKKLAVIAGTKDEIAIDRLLSRPHAVLEMFQAYIDATGIVKAKDDGKPGSARPDDEYAGATANGV